MKTYNDKQLITKHYDSASLYYHSLWGEHLHHGYWVTGEETKEEAQLALTKHLAQVSSVKFGSKILDVGCGFGASSIFLAKNFGAQTTGITISPVQVKMACDAAEQANVSSRFLLMDADALAFKESFDVIWSIESISHYKDKANFFKRASELLNPGGVVAIIDWFRKENLSTDEHRKYILPIEKGMMVELHPMQNYLAYLESSGLQIVKTEDISRETEKTWDISLDIIKNKSFWQLAIKNGPEFVDFLRSFKAMRAGFSSGNFIYGLIVAKNPNKLNDQNPR